MIKADQIPPEVVEAYNNNWGEPAELIAIALAAGPGAYEKPRDSVVQKPGIILPLPQEATSD